MFMMLLLLLVVPANFVVLLLLVVLAYLYGVVVAAAAALFWSIQDSAGRQKRSTPPRWTSCATQATTMPSFSVTPSAARRTQPDTWKMMYQKT
jgi:hypothetical protein